MSCLSAADPGESRIHLLPATEDMGARLRDVLDRHEIAFERQADLVVLPDAGRRARLVSLLRHVLAEPERQAVSVIEFPRARTPCAQSARAQTIDEWWHFHQTAWYSEAMANDRFETLFQPIVDTARQRLLGHECLIRLTFPRIFHGAEIVDAARLRNDLHVFDSHARTLAIRSAARQAPADRNKDNKYFVNFMPSSVYDPERCLGPTITALDECGMKPENIVFEIAESDSARDLVHLRRICDYFRLHGFGFALDNAGTGGDTSRIARDLRPHYIKLDKNLVRNIEQPANAATIRSLVDLSGRLGIVLIAQGVERIESMENLWLLGVHCMQGYFFGRPAPAPGNVSTQAENYAQPAAPRASKDSPTRQILTALSANPVQRH